MAFVRRNPFSLTLGLLIVAVLGVLVAMNLPRSTSTARAEGALEGQPELKIYDPLEAALYSRVQGLRGELGLTDQDLAAINCTDAEVEAVLVQLIAWTQAQAQSLDNAERQVREARRALQSSWQRLNTTQVDASVRALHHQKESTVQSSLESRRLLALSAVSSIEPKMNGEAAAVWSVIRGNIKVSRPARYVPGLSSEQAKQISRERYLQAMGSTLSVSQHQAMTLAWANQSQHAGRVIKVSARVLPVPEELRAQEITTPDQNQESP